LQLIQNNGKDNMIRKLIFFIVALGVTSNYANGSEVLIEGKAAYFLPENKKFRKIYPDLGLYGAEVSVALYPQLYGWVAIDTLSKTGTSLGCKQKTNLWMMPVDAGLKYFFACQSLPVNFYVGAGLSATYVNIHDHSPYVIAKTSRWGVGGIGKLGSIVYVDDFFLDLFVNYSYVPIDFPRYNQRNVSRNSMNFGGWAFGIGLGYKFPCL
jgi:outer membrane protein W